MIYYDIVTRVVKLFKVLPMIIMMIFNMSTSYFSQKNISLFWKLFNDKIDLKVKVVDQYLLGELKAPQQWQARKCLYMYKVCKEGVIRRKKV
jgi:hypothetical protein